MIWSLTLFQNHLSIPTGIPKFLQELYLLVKRIVQTAKNQKKRVANIVFEAIVLSMDYQKHSVTLNPPNSTSGNFLSIEVSAMQYLGSFTSIKKAPVVPLLNESQEGTSCAPTRISTPTLTDLFDNILQLIIYFNWVQARTKVDSKTTQNIEK
ncbi:hypothetical protein O181_098997 [Austropuccinia psidii MF-1]|uniref:Uncharacterized protein n=1 Tax=Austropuccinia psidii MF-1 TaxID=1389203 RepID=A0A9Q3PG38_9BASI|nr:hypothetical protein [Austropuccinia psidii MF-1]